MRIKTKFFDEVEIDDNRMIVFPDGIPGFEENKSFVILDIADCSFKCLQSTEEQHVCMLLANPFDYFKDYDIDIEDEDVAALGITSIDDVQVYTVVAFHEEKVTTNLVAPIIINVSQLKGKQIVFSGTEYSIRQELKC
jgi:flagellar assembly factor FliW